MSSVVRHLKYKYLHVICILYSTNFQNVSCILYFNYMFQSGLYVKYNLGRGRFYTRRLFRFRLLALKASTYFVPD